MERRPDTNAFVRTTTAVTMFNAGVKVQQAILQNKGDLQQMMIIIYSCNLCHVIYLEKSFFFSSQVNIIPSLAEAYVNLRIHSAQTLQEVWVSNLSLFF